MDFLKIIKIIIAIVIYALLGWKIIKFVNPDFIDDSGLKNILKMIITLAFIFVYWFVALKFI